MEATTEMKIISNIALAKTVTAARILVEEFFDDELGYPDWEDSILDDQRELRSAINGSLRGDELGAAVLAVYLARLEMEGE